MKDYKELIYTDLIDLGVSKGDTLMVHMALSSMPKFINKPQIIIEALIKAIEVSGTLLMPALSYESVTDKQPVFDLMETPSCVGGLAEYFRKLPSTFRSVHPTHSVCANGKNAKTILSEHHLDNTPCGLKSPFSKLKDLNGKILLLGCGLKPNSTMHAIEELSQPAYLFGKTTAYTMITNDIPTYKKEYIDHSFKGFEQRYDRVLDILDPNDYSFGKVLDAEAFLINVSPMWGKANKEINKNPLYFVDKI